MLTVRNPPLDGVTTWVTEDGLVGAFRVNGDDEIYLIGPGKLRKPWSGAGTVPAAWAALGHHTLDDGEAP